MKTFLAAAFAALALPSTAAAAEVLYGVTQTNNLVTFHSDSPGALRSHVPLTGLAENEHAIAIDIRPKTGQLYLLGSSSRVFVVNPASGSAFPLSAAFSPALAGGNFGIDFAPNDRLRLVSDGRQNLRLNPDDGQVAGDDAALAYADGDPGAGTNPSFASVAHAADKVFVIDTARDALGTSANLNDGKIATVGALNVDIKEPTELDVAADGRAWAVGAADPDARVVQLWSVDLATGALAPGAGRPVVSGAYGLVRGIAAAGPVPDDTQPVEVLVSVDRRQSRRALRRVHVDVACSEACDLAASLRRKRRKRAIARGDGRMEEPSTVRIHLSRARVPRRGFPAVLRVVATDAAGNLTVVRRRLRFS